MSKDSKDNYYNIESIHLTLYTNDEKYRRLLAATCKDESVEGSIAVDTMMAALMIREQAKIFDFQEIANQKLADVVKGLNVVMRRYKCD
jgi:hypothetical protein